MAKDTFKPLLQALAANVKAYRLENELTQEELADSAELDRTYVSQLERARCNPSLLVLEKVARCLGVSVIDLLQQK